MKTKLVLGYCCINTELRKRGIFSSRTLRLRTLQEKGMEYLYSLIDRNIEDTFCLMEWNHAHQIYNFRISSELMPFASHPDYYDTFDMSRFADSLRRLGDFAKEHKQYVSFHPGQYNQLTSVRDSVIEKTVHDLDTHARILDLMGFPDAPIIIHGGARGRSKEESLERFKCNFKLLSESTRRKLVVENDEIVYTVKDLLPLGLPVVFDTHHHNLNPGGMSPEDAAKLCADTFISRNKVPLMHISESRESVKPTDSITARRAHSDFVSSIPEYLWNLGVEKIYIDIEAKMKEQAVLKLMQLNNLD
ncbi:UV DNA damage repair endonuclease UvsE [bacterium]|nr:UV DNA damage repair endonuclease UvsE [bacterium]NDC93905.1 UV DNA damage repair endonuclease UvsE [bacterium]NDD83261.1 UV DNA damage repair endonuclease UvsE [bacterium]NDG28883.1 UV DNA damage repair endonuclease UvsE [bacterium]